MGKVKRVSGDYVFRADEAGDLSFVGDFEGLYRSSADPWGQEGSDERMEAYYRYSRENLLSTVNGIAGPTAGPVDLLEVGAGLGHVAAYLKEGAAGKMNITGMDISPTATAKARKNFPAISFVTGDITSPDLSVKGGYHVVVMSQILWYILEKLPLAVANAGRLLKENGFLIFVNAFLQEQRYGRDIVDGFDGLLKYLLLNHSGEYRVVKAEIDYSGTFLHNDGIIVLQRIG